MHTMTPRDQGGNRMRHHDVGAMPTQTHASKKRSNFCEWNILHPRSTTNSVANPVLDKTHHNTMLRLSCEWAWLNYQLCPWDPRCECKHGSKQNDIATSRRHRSITETITPSMRIPWRYHAAHWAITRGTVTWCPKLVVCKDRLSAPTTKSN